MKAIIAFPCPTIGVCGDTMARRKCLPWLHALQVCSSGFHLCPTALSQPSIGDTRFKSTTAALIPTSAFSEAPLPDRSNLRTGARCTTLLVPCGRLESV
jgi:hypothetical protein